MDNFFSNNTEDFKKDIIITTPHILFLNYEKNNIDFLNALHEANIGVMFVDECHVGVGPEKFSKASLNISAYRTYGLSATPRRSDGNNDIMNYHLGEIVTFPVAENEIIDTTIFMIYLPFGVYAGKTIRYINWGGSFNMSKYFQQLRKAEPFFNRISKWIKDAHINDRKILVLSKTIEPLISLFEVLQLPPEDVGFFSPSITKKEYKKRVTSLSDTLDLDEAFFTKKIIASTYSFARDGNNRIDLDCLVMLTPTGNIEQAIGRIQRACENKKSAIVIDLVDIEGPLYNSYFDNTKKVSLWVRSAEKRKEIYKQKNWEIKEIFLK
jgi:superfamily II DNA or RNA helicase